MATAPTDRVIQRLLAGGRADGMTDGELLTRFLSGRDDDALTALVRRHGSMVWGVCRRLLHNPSDAEDAFQATFLVLVQKAATLPNRETVGNWLYGVARQTAVRLRAVVAKRGVRERQVAAPPEPATADQCVWSDLSPVIDEELGRLPAKYRVLVVLCDLEGVTRKEVARRLGIPEGTAASRLAAARAMLAKRLVRRGVAVSGSLLGAVLSHQSAWAGVPTAVVTSTVRAATLVAAGQAVAGAISPTVTALYTGVTKAMVMTKFKSVLAVVLTAALVGGAGLVYTTAAGQDDKKLPTEPAAKEAEADEPLTVRADPQKLRVRPKEGFEVRLRVINSSPAAQSFQVMTCSWFDQWKASSERVAPDTWDCAENGKVTETLQPGQAYEKTLTMRLASGEPGEKVPFRMGFTPVGGKRTVWSNEVVLQVQAEDEPAADQKKGPPAEKVKGKAKEAEAFTAWGEAVNGLQAGVGLRPGGRRAYRPGETVALVVRVRNVGTEVVGFEHLTEFFAENPPTVTDAVGKGIPETKGEATKRMNSGLTAARLAPGKEVELASTEYRIARKIGPGTIHVRYERVFGNTPTGRIKVDPDLLKLSTGTLELEIVADPPVKKGVLSGVWVTDVATSNGKERVEEKGVELEFDQEQVLIREPGRKEIPRLSYMLGANDRGVQNITLYLPNMIVGSDPLEPQTPRTNTIFNLSHGIFKVEGDSLTFCIKSPYLQLPQVFSDEGQVLWKLKRKPAKPTTGKPMEPPPFEDKHPAAPVDTRLPAEKPMEPAANQKKEGEKSAEPPTKEVGKLRDKLRGHLSKSENVLEGEIVPAEKLGVESGLPILT